MEYFQLLPNGEGWRVHTRRTTYWALTQQQLASLVADAGFTDVEWLTPESSGFFQPILLARTQ
ncbi:hypothetical protein [Actinopolymorpha rutila]|uniref:Uncharacterized protein n=1 Tax=Actinopolymorpha rutila TaxID=446787 RepID=A0A852ZVX7_9ACTN|nr:hypothetical protein [Actinopolymorpha rutila]NYH92846.1 hypothetical protein [Actinopolymorpha rutila]